MGDFLAGNAMKVKRSAARMRGLFRWRRDPGMGLRLCLLAALIAIPVVGTAQIEEGIMFNRGVYRCSDEARITLIVDGLDAEITFLRVLVTNPRKGDFEEIDLLRAAEESPAFITSPTLLRIESDFPIEEQDDVIAAVHGDEIKVTYIIDIDSGTSFTDTARIDCVGTEFGEGGPVVRQLSESIVDLGVRWNELARTTLYLGTSCNDDPTTIGSSRLADNFQTRLTGLTSCTQYHYFFEVFDEAGNRSFLDADLEAKATSETLNCFTFTTGRDFVLFEETSDPTIDPRWAFSSTPEGASGWRGDFIYVRSPPYSFGIDDTGTVTDARMISPPVCVIEGMALWFYHTYHLEAISIPPDFEQFFFDGAVLEITTDGGDNWEDLGAQIEEGGYVGELSTQFNNPLEGRPAWSGGELSQERLNLVRVNLTPYAGETVQFRWRLGTDDSFPDGGWFIDDIRVFDLRFDCASTISMLAFDEDQENCDPGLLRFTIQDPDLTLHQGQAPSDFRVGLAESGITRAMEPLNLSRLDDCLGIWEGYVRVEKAAKPETLLIGGVLEIPNGEELELQYTDPDMGDGVPGTVSDTILLDCEPPKLILQTTNPEADNEVIITIQSDEPAHATLMFGLECSDTPVPIASSGFSENIEFNLDGLSPCTAYFYRIVLEDALGNQATYDNQGVCFGFKTAQGSLALFDDLEPQPNTGWVHSADAGVDDWRVLSTNFARSGNFAWFARALPVLKDSSLVMPPVDIVEDQRLRFWHSFRFQTLFGSGLIGAVLEISTDGGATWTDLGPYIQRGGYTGDLIDGPLLEPGENSREAWIGGTFNLDLEEVTVLLNDFAGEDRLIRYRIGCAANSSASSGDGWYLDDFYFETFGSCGDIFPLPPRNPVPADGAVGIAFDQNLVLDWSDVIGAFQYQVYWGLTPETTMLLGATGSSSITFPQNLLKAGTTIYWRVLAVNSIGASSSDTWSFRLNGMDPNRVAQELIGIPTLSAPERSATDYDNDGVVRINDLINVINLQE